jgi:hypothetical protein
MVDPLITAFRAPVYANTPNNTTIDATLTPDAGGETEISADVPTNTKSYALWIAANNVNTPAGGISKHFIEIYLNNSLVARYDLPDDWNTGKWSISEVVPVIKDFRGAGNTFTIKLGAGAGAQYNVTLKSELLAVNI